MMDAKEYFEQCVNDETTSQLRWRIAAQNFVDKITSLEKQLEVLRELLKKSKSLVKCYCFMDKDKDCLRCAISKALKAHDKLKGA